MRSSSTRWSPGRYGGTSRRQAGRGRRRRNCGSRVRVAARRLRGAPALVLLRPLQVPARERPAHQAEPPGLTPHQPSQAHRVCGPPSPPVSQPHGTGSSAELGQRDRYSGLRDRALSAARPPSASDQRGRAARTSATPDRPSAPPQGPTSTPRARRAAWVVASMSAVVRVIPVSTGVTSLPGRGGASPIPVRHGSWPHDRSRAQLPRVADRPAASVGLSRRMCGC